MRSEALYHKYKKGRHWENHPTAYAERFTSFLKEQDFHGLLVDVGCGTGRDVDVFSDNGFNVLGIDKSEEMLALAKLNFPHCNLEKQDAEKLSFSNGAISAYFMINVIHYVNQEQTIRELYRTLHKEGYVFAHFNKLIVDDHGYADYQQSESEIFNLVSCFDVIDRKVFERVDKKPKKHTHNILELILQKK